MGRTGLVESTKGLFLSGLISAGRGKIHAD
jgi:hypothetical protein